MKKTLLALSLLIFAITAQATTFNATIDDIWCGEMDPFAIGDVCVVFVTKEKGNSKLGILFDFDAFLEENDEYEIMIGRKATINSATYSKIRDREIIDILKRFDSSYFYLQASDFGESIVLID